MIAEMKNSMNRVTNKKDKGKERIHIPEDRPEEVSQNAGQQNYGKESKKIQNIYEVEIPERKKEQRNGRRDNI